MALFLLTVMDVKNAMLGMGDQLPEPCDIVYTRERERQVAIDSKLVT